MRNLSVYIRETNQNEHILCNVGLCCGAVMGTDIFCRLLKIGVYIKKHSCTFDIFQRASGIVLKYGKEFLPRLVYKMCEGSIYYYVRNKNCCIVYTGFDLTVL